MLLKLLQEDLNNSFLSTSWDLDLFEKQNSSQVYDEVIEYERDIKSCYKIIEKIVPLFTSLCTSIDPPKAVI